MYIRVSAVMNRADDQFHSPDLQAAAMRDLLARRGLVEVAVVEDIDRTGRDFNRDGIRRVLEMARAGEVDVVALYDFSRLGRNTAESLRVISELRECGVAVMSSVEQVDDSPEGQFMLGQFLGMAQLYSDQRSRQWRDVARFRAERGLPHGKVPLGYRRSRPSGPLEPDPVTAPVVVELFRRAAAGASMHALAEEATRLLGRRVFWTAVKVMLHNPVYVGRIRLGGREYDGAHEAIVDDATWHRVARQRAVNAGKPSRRIAGAYPLTGLLVCDSCSAFMNHHRVTEGTASTVRVECRTKVDRFADCEGPGRPPAAAVEDEVLRWIAERIRLLKVDETTRLEVKASRARARVDAGRLRRELAATDVAIGRLTGDFARRVISEVAYQAAVRDLEESRRLLVERLAVAESVVDAGTPAQVRKVAEQLLARWSEMTGGERNRALRVLVREVRLRRASRWREPLDGRVEVQFLD